MTILGDRRDELLAHTLNGAMTSGNHSVICRYGRSLGHFMVRFWFNRVNQIRKLDAILNTIALSHIALLFIVTEDTDLVISRFRDKYDRKVTVAELLMVKVVLFRAVIRAMNSIKL